MHLFVSVSMCTCIRHSAFVTLSDVLATFCKLIWQYRPLCTFDCKRTFMFHQTSNSSSEAFVSTLSTLCVGDSEPAQWGYLLHAPCHTASNHPATHLLVLILDGRSSYLVTSSSFPLLLPASSSYKLAFMTEGFSAGEGYSDVVGFVVADLWGGASSWKW